MKVRNPRQVSLGKPQFSSKRLAIILSATLCFSLAAIFLRPEKKVLARTAPLKAVEQSECAPPANKFYFSSWNQAWQSDWGAPEVRDEKTEPIGESAPVSIETRSPVYGNGAYAGSYAKSTGTASGNTISVHQEAYLKWNKSHEGWSFSWPRFSVRSYVFAYTKVRGLPVKLHYKAKVKYQYLTTDVVGLSAGYFPGGYLSETDYQFTLECRAKTDPIEEGSDLYELGTSCPFGYPNFMGPFVVESKADKNGFLNWEPAIAEGKVTIDVEVIIEPLITPAIAQIKGPLLNGKAEEKVYIGETVQFESESYDPDNNQGTTPGAGISAYQWMVTDPEGKDATPGNAILRTLELRPTKEGTYTVKLLVSDDEGLQSCQTKTVFVRKPKVETVHFVSVYSPLDGNLNIGGGKRIFPDKRTPDDDLDRSVVKVLAQIDAREGTPVYFRFFDVDDPFSSRSPIDDNDRGEEGEKGGDNRDIVAGLVPLGSTVKDGKAETYLFVSRQPGDNFVVAASLDDQYLAGCRAEGSTLGGSGVKDKENKTLPTENAKNTEMLTVWRYVYIEVDKMKPVRDNYVEGRVTGMNFPPNRPVTELSYHQSPKIPWPETARFGIDPKNKDKGAIVIFDRNCGVFDPKERIPAYINSNGAIVVEAILERNDTMGRCFRLWDDDNLNGAKDGDQGFEVPYPATEAITSSLKDAYIEPVFSFDSKPADFILNGIAGSWDTEKYNSPNYWTMYLCGAYQPTDIPLTANSFFTADGDQEIEITLGITYYPGGGSHVFFEVIRESSCASKAIFSTPAHEIGHQFGILGEEIDFSLMDGTGAHTCQAELTYNSRSLATIRNYRGNQ
jgi:hypothetical protein